MSSDEPTGTQDSNKRQRELTRYVILILVITVGVVGILLLMGQLSGNIFSNIVGSL
jgi:hypothetical protein